MGVLLAIVSCAVLFVAPGLALLRWLGARDGSRRLSVVEAAVLVPCLSMLVSSVVGLVLAEVGAFSLPLLLGIVAAIAVALWITRRRVRVACERGAGWWIDLAFVGAIAVACVVLYFRPHEYVFGGWDPSVYMNTGASIERTGGILYRDEAFAALPSETQQAFVHTRDGIDQRFPGLLIADHETGLITPQFHHLYPTWLAVFRAWGGDRAMLYVTPLFGVLSVLMLFVLSRRFLSQGAAYAATLLLAFGLAQVWQARFSTAEITAQLCILAMVYLLLVYFETSSTSAAAGTAGAVLAALALGMAMQARYDSALLVPLLALVVYARNLKAWQRRDWVLAVGGVVAVAHVVLHSIFISFLYRPALQRITGHPARAAAVFGAAVVVLVVFLVAFRWRPSVLSALLTGRALRIAMIVLIIIGAFFAYVVRPELKGAEKEADPHNLVALGWLMTRLGLMLAVAGVCLLVWRARTHGELALLVVGIVLAVVYVKSARIEDFYMWRARRFVPVVMPMLCLFAGYGLAVMAAPLKRWRPVACGAVALALTVSLLVKHPKVVTTRDNRGAIDFVARVAETLDPDAVYICNGYWLATPLRMFHGIEAYAVSDPEPDKCRTALAHTETLLDEGRTAYFIDQDRPHVFPQLACVPIEDGRFPFHWRRLARTDNAIPAGAEAKDLHTVLYRLKSAPLGNLGIPEAGLTWEFELDWFNVERSYRREDVKLIDVLEIPDGRRINPPPDTPDEQITQEYAWVTGRYGALGLPYLGREAYVVEILLSGLGREYGVDIFLAGRWLATVEPVDEYRTMVVETPPDPYGGQWNEKDRGTVSTLIAGGTLLEFVSLAPEGYTGPQGIWIDRIRLRPVETDSPAE